MQTMKRTPGELGWAGPCEKGGGDWRRTISRHVRTRARDEDGRELSSVQPAGDKLALAIVQFEEAER